eukprot:6150036-Pleurochrysis_carterae.AAC.1
MMIVHAHARTWMPLKTALENGHADPHVHTHVHVRIHKCASPEHVCAHSRSCKHASASAAAAPPRACVIV